MMDDIQTVIERLKVDLQKGKSVEEILPSSLSFFGKDPQTDGKIAEGLAALPDVQVARLLHRMLEVSKDKKVQKVIKRSLYRLRSKGVMTEEVPLRKEDSILRPLQTGPTQGFGTSIDPLGQRLLLLNIPHGGRGLIVLQGLVSDLQGIIDFSREEMTRKGFRDFFKEMKDKNPFPFVEVEPSYVGFLFNQAYQLTLEKGRTPPQDYLRSKNEIERLKGEDQKPLAYSYLPVSEIVEDDRFLRKGGDLLKADIFSGWRIEEEQIEPYVNEVREAEQSRIVLNPAQKEARFQGIYQKALSTLFSDERRMLYRRRLEEMAYLLFKLGREEEAKTSLAVAIDLEKPLNLIQPNPFLFQLVVGSIFARLAEAYEKETTEPSLIVKPFQRPRGSRT